MDILGGDFRNNQASAQGGVWYILSGGDLHVFDGIFEGNEAEEGGVGASEIGHQEIRIMGGLYSGNTADNGGVFAIAAGANFSVRTWSSPGSGSLEGEVLRGWRRIGMLHRGVVSDIHPTHVAAV